METKESPSAFCPIFHKAVELIGRRWTGAIIRAMYSGRTRFCDIGAAVPGLSDRLLSERLKELEAAGLVIRTVIPETPVRIEYALSEMGRDLDAVLNEIGQWAHRWLPSEGESAIAEFGSLEGECVEPAAERIAVVQS